MALFFFFSSRCLLGGKREADLGLGWRSSRVKQLKEEPYTQKEAEAAAGLGTDNGRIQEQGARKEEMEIG
jgi:hypothetical protein